MNSRRAAAVDISIAGRHDHVLRAVLEHLHGRVAGVSAHVAAGVISAVGENFVVDRARDNEKAILAHQHAADWRGGQCHERGEAWRSEQRGAVLARAGFGRLEIQVDAGIRGEVGGQRRLRAADEIVESLRAHLCRPAVRKRGSEGKITHQRKLSGALVAAPFRVRRSAGAWRSEPVERVNELNDIANRPEYQPKLELWPSPAMTPTLVCLADFPEPVTSITQFQDGILIARSTEFSK